MPSSPHKKPRPKRAVDRVIANYADGGMVSLTAERGNTRALACACSSFKINRVCKHIKLAMQQRVDQPWLDMGTVYVLIYDNPLFMVKLQLHQYDDELCSVYTVEQDRTGTFLGYIREGDGLMDARQLFVEWIIGQAQQAYHGAHDVSFCTSPHHSGKQWLLEGFDEVSTQHAEIYIYLRDIYMMIQQGMCFECADTSRIPI